MTAWIKYSLGILILALSLTILFNLSNNASAADAHLDQDGWEWHYDTGAPNTLTSVVQTGAGTEVNIPINLDGSTPLTTLATSCLNGAQAQKITKVLSMPATVTTIGNNFFYNDINLTSCIVGSGVTSMAWGPFYGCTGLLSITFQGLTAPTIGDNFCLNHPAGLRGHAYSTSNFPIPGNLFVSILTMGDYINPIISSGAAAISVNEDSNYYYNATSTQIGTWSIATLHSWMVLNSSSGKITGTPIDANVSVHTVSLSVYNANGSGYLNWTLTVINIAPNITSTPITVDSMAGTYHYDADASEAVTWAITCSDPDIDIDSNGVVSGYLSNDTAITVCITATDASGGIAYQNYTILVHGPNTDLAPMMVGIIPVIALIVIFGIGMNSIKRKRG